MVTTVLVVRHGQTNSNVTGFYVGWSDEHLDESGYTQARRLSSRLASLPIASVYTSPLRRARTTAAIVAEPHKLGLEVLDDLTEIRLGDWQGLHMDEIKRRWPGLWQQSSIDPSELTMPNGESFRQVTERAVRAFNAEVGLPLQLDKTLMIWYDDYGHKGKMVLLRLYARYRNDGEKDNMARRPNWRRVSVVPEVTYFKPRGVSAAALEEVILAVDEAEAIRLKDLEGLEQERCAEAMRVSRTTFARILESGRQKMADALLNGKAIRIKGGNFEMAERPFRCLDGHEWNVPFEVMTTRPPQSCPKCRSPNILPLQPPGFGWGRR